MDESQYRAILKHFRPDLQAVIVIGYNFGWRIRAKARGLDHVIVPFVSCT